MVDEVQLLIVLLIINLLTILKTIIVKCNFLMFFLCLAIFQKPQRHRVYGEKTPFLCASVAGVPVIINRS